MTTTTVAEATAAAMSLSALALGWSLQNVVLGIILFFYCCQGGRGGEGEGGDWRLRRCARRRERGQRRSHGCEESDDGLRRCARRRWGINFFFSHYWF